MLDEKWISPPEDLSASVEKAAFMAAAGALSGLTGGETTERAGVRRVLSAFAAARAVEKSASLEFVAQHPGKSCHGFHIDTHLVVCSAFFAEIAGFSPNEVNPTCAAGQWLTELVTACAILEALGSAGVLADGLSSALGGEWAADRGIALLDEES